MIQCSSPVLPLCQHHIYTAVSRTDQPERHFSMSEKQQPHGEEVAESRQEGLGPLLAAVADEAVWQNCQGELSLQVTGDPPTTDVPPVGAQARSWLRRCRASWCWSGRGSGLGSVKPWGMQAVVSRAVGRPGRGCHSKAMGWPSRGQSWSLAQSVAAGRPQGRRGSQWLSPAPRAGARTIAPSPARCHSWATRSSAT